MLFENLVLRLLLEILHVLSAEPLALSGRKTVKKAWRYIEHHTVGKDYEDL